MVQFWCSLQRQHKFPHSEQQIPKYYNNEHEKASPCVCVRETDFRGNSFEPVNRSIKKPFVAAKSLQP